MTEQNKTKIGKLLSMILRHEPEKIGITLDENGWAEVKELREKCARKHLHFTIDELEEIVATNNKKRYSFNENKTKIRANQGHSIDIDIDLPTITPPEFLYHGTAERFLSSIGEKGIQKMSRQHVHLSHEKSTAENVGSRHGKAVVLTILSRKMYADGIKFYQAANGVWLTDYIDPKYISK